MNDPIEQNETVETPQSPEDRFFGVTTPITKPDKQKTEPEVVVTVEEPEEPINANDDTPADDMSAAKDGASDEEMENYSEKVKKRINKLTWEREEAKRQFEEEKQRRALAENWAKGQQNQISQYEDVIRNGEARLVQQFKQGAEYALAAAKQQYAQAYEEGDTEKVIAAQEALIKANAEMEQATGYEQNYNWRMQNWANQQRMAQAQPQMRQPPPQQQVPKPSEISLQWGAENKWFHDPQHPDMTAFAYGQDQKLRMEGVRPDTPEYFEAIDKAMRKHFPDYFGVDKASSAPGSVVAPASRATGSTPRQVKLNEREKRLAKKLGVTDEQFAAQKRFLAEKQQ